MPGNPRKKSARQLDHLDTKSLLGEALLAGRKYTEAEQLLLTGYDGMKRHGLDRPGAAPTGPALKRIVNMYAALGKEDEAMRWRKNRSENHAPDQTVTTEALIN